MMQKKKNNKKKWIITLVTLVLLIGAGVGTFFILKGANEQKDDKVEVTDSQEEEEKSGIQTSSDDGTNTDNSGNGMEKPKVVQYDGDDPNKAEELSGVVTYAGVTDGKLMIRVNIDQYLESGTCELTLVRGGDTIYNSIASIIGGPSTATCEGFDVPVAGLGGGQIEIKINLSADSRNGTIRGEANI